MFNRKNIYGTLLVVCSSIICSSVKAAENTSQRVKDFDEKEWEVAGPTVTNFLPSICSSEAERFVPIRNTEQRNCIQIRTNNKKTCFCFVVVLA